MTQTDLFLWAVAGLGLIGYVFFFRRGTPPPDLRLTKPYKIGDLPTNTDARISGTVAFSTGSTPLTAPLTGRACAAWVLRIEQNSYQRRSPSKQILRQQHVADFLVRDDSGAVLVGGTGLRLFLTPDHTAEGLSETLISLLAEHDLKPREPTGFLAYESILKVDDNVVVVGTASPTPTHEAAGYRGAHSRLRMGPLTNGPLVIAHELRYLA